MQTVGSVLKEERLKQGLTLESISVDTKLPLRSLSAIESDQVSTFGSQFFYKSFVKQYASRIQVDYRAIAPQVEAQASEIPVPPLPGETTHPPDVPAIDPPKSRARLRWVFPSVALIAVLVGCSGVYAWWEGQHGLTEAGTPAAASAAASQSTTPIQASSSSDSTPSTATSTTSGDASSSSGGASPVAAPDASPKSEQAVTPDAVPTASASEVQLKLSALEQVWVSVIADGNSIFTGVLQARDTKVFESRETAKIRIGNAGCVQVVYNGRSIGALGPRGQVLTAVFTPQNYEILSNEGQPPPVAQLGLTKYTIGE